MRKVLSIFLTVVILTIMLAGCQTKPNDNNTTPENTQTDNSEPVDIRIGGLKGPTSMGMVKLMEAAEAGEATNNYTFTISGSADEVTPKLIKGELDMAAVPANLASVLYNNTNGEVKLLAVNTLGVIYIVEKGNEVQSFEDLKGKTIYATGKGSTPEYALRYLLSENGIDPDKDVKLEWKAEPTEVVALLSELENGVAMMPQPFVTVAQTQIEGLRIAIDLTKEWDALDNGSALITGVLVVRKDFAEKHPKQIAAFLDEYKQSTEYVNANIPEASKLVEKYGIVKAAVAEKAIPYCNIYFMEGTEMKTSMQGYLNVLFEQNQKSIGGELPKDDFYYEK
ncbi:MAG: ABC transporter substrate-binding protein [Firmicutes bacterium]|nr:ABC transporter substrate-binding protein [Bacillota bacterium]MDD3298805.1 ABC transporter substrate-binding protein [Bacillota bacterium]MDD3850347.1 ABC transporter substrate-binding protein [Bacillota bacterium]